MLCSSPIGRFWSLLSCQWKCMLHQPTILLQCGEGPFPIMAPREEGTCHNLPNLWGPQGRTSSSSYSLLRVSLQLQHQVKAVMLLAAQSQEKKKSLMKLNKFEMTVTQDRSKSYRTLKRRFLFEDTVLQLQYWIATCLTKVFLSYTSIVYWDGICFLFSCSGNNSNTPFENMIWHP